MSQLIQGTFTTGSTAAPSGGEFSAELIIDALRTSLILNLSGLDASNTVKTQKRTTPGGAWVDQTTYSSAQVNVSVTVAAGEQWRLATVAMQAIRAITYSMELGAQTQVTSTSPVATPQADTTFGLIPFTLNVSCDQDGTMPTQTVSSVLNFVVSPPGATSAKGVVIVDLLADGVNAPTITGAREADSSSGYQNIIGVRNSIQFFARSGVAYYTINQRLSLAPEAGYPLAQVVRFASLFNMTESGNATTGWSYACTSATFMGNNAIAALSMPPSTDCEVAHTIPVVATGDLTLMINSNLATANDYNSAQYGAWVTSAGNAASTESGFPSIGGAGTFINGDTVRIVLTRSTNTMVVYRSRAGVLTALKTYTSVPNVRLYIGIGGSGVGSTSQNPRGTNLS